MDKYMSFDPWRAGHNNIIMSFSLACAISEITGRILIIPPKWPIAFFTGSVKKEFKDWWGVVDKTKFLETFNCIEYKDVPEYVNLEDSESYFSNIEDIARVYKSRLVENSLVYVCDVKNQDDFEKFNLDGRKVIDLNVSEKFIHFDNNLFGHFYYHIYANSLKDRRSIREKIKKGIVYKNRLLFESRKVGDQLGNFNAIHVRRGDFEYVRSKYMQSPEELLKSLKSKFSPKLPLYIATDKKDKHFFTPVRREYNVFFARDFDFKYDEGMELPIIEQLVCSQGEEFVGSLLSTFTDQIHVLRGYRGDKKDQHRQSLTLNRPELKYNEYPWEVERYSWDKIWKYQWENI